MAAEEEAEQRKARWAKALYWAVHMEHHAIEDGGLSEPDRIRDTVSGALHLGISYAGTAQAENMLGVAYTMCLGIAKRYPDAIEMLEGTLGQSLRALWGFTTEAQREGVAKLRAVAAEGGDPCKHSGH